MCGISGHYAYSSDAPPVDREALLRTRDSMTARGPDGAGIWFSGDGKLGLAHRRLAIIDLTEAGAQPMHSTDGRYAVTFNGEIYNYPSLRATLEKEGVIFRSHSDTEVLLHLYRRDGAAMVEKLRGMFAFAIWDAHARSLFLARDPHGIKPLYYANDGHSFRFASQVSALKAGGNIDLSPDPAGTVGFLLWGSVPEPFTLHRGICLLPAGSTLTVTPTGPSKAIPYWRIASILQRASIAADSIPRGGEAEYLREQLLDSVKAHLVADVPVGAFLSAGLDSSTLVGLAREAAAAPLQTLTLSFDDFQGTHNDECPMAADIARHLDVKHRCIVLPTGELDHELDRFFAAMDQPTVDGINTWFISHAATQAGLKVALSGLGGDELLGGYASFQQVPALMARARRSPWGNVAPLYRSMHSLLGAWLKWSPNAAGIPQYGMTPEGAYHLAKGVFMPWELSAVIGQDALAEGMQVLANEDAAQQESIDGLSLFQQVMYLESVRYMRNQLLRDTDWVSMAHSLEIRVPLVDSQLTSAIAGLAAQGRLGKSDLPGTLAHPLPDSVRKRPKTGFTTPTWKWLRHHPGLDAWRSIPFLNQSRVRDSRRWAYTLLHRVPETHVILK
jgi:asparagine synthase (glutamine-hydrolysing)